MTIESKIKQLAKILVEHSVKVKPGELVQIKFEGFGKPLVDELTKEISLKGAYYLVTMNISNRVKMAPMSNLEREVPGSREIANKIDCLISIDDDEDLYELKNVKAERLNAVSKANHDVHEYIINNKKWCIVRYPTVSYAQQAGMSFEEYSDYAFKTMITDWKKVKDKLALLKNKLDKTNIVRIVGKETDISFSVKNRKSIVAAGEYNMPDGELFTAPVADSTTGELFIPIAFHDSEKFENLKLYFEKGRVVNFSVKGKKKKLEKLLSVDSNAKRLGELGIGINKGIKEIVGDILFDEKKNHTVHLALGSAYHECFNEDLKKMKKNDVSELTNSSSLHWDLIISPEKVFFDNKEQKIWE
ncbi:Thermophilic metalloprotease (M29) [Candidatus Tiddalikarchaeum anstoanum]|nr:Thermophilic metalloprotease (M29) [Candidatus Tiddalikarchaeum anstoanum]